MKMTNPEFPLDELLLLIKQTLDPLAETHANTLALLVECELHARGDRGVAGNIINVTPGRHDEMYILFRPLSGERLLTIVVNNSDFKEIFGSSRKRINRLFPS